jgi:acetolactate synthase regulatory subunit
MNTHALPLTFSIDNSSTLDTLEAVLAIARRGGLRLAGLTLAPDAFSDRVSLQLVADEPDLLDLFQARLANLVGVHDITPCRQSLQY